MKRIEASLALISAAAALAGCGSGEGPRAAAVGEGRLRDLVVRGVGEDFRRGTHAGPPGFPLCLRLGVRRALDRAALRRLLSISRRPEGIPQAAQALNGLAVPIGDSCGGRRFVPELTSAAAALKGVRLVEPRAHRVGLAYGPYIGLSCPRGGSPGCDRVGIDLVLRRHATSVEATVAGRRVELATPGPVPHDAGATGRDWGGYLRGAGLHRGARLRVSLLVTYPGARRETMKPPPTYLSPGFG